MFISGLIIPPTYPKEPSFLYHMTVLFSSVIEYQATSYMTTWGVDDCLTWVKMVTYEKENASGQRNHRRTGHRGQVKGVIGSFAGFTQNISKAN